MCNSCYNKVVLHYFCNYRTCVFLKHKKNINNSSSTLPYDRFVSKGEMFVAATTPKDFWTNVVKLKFGSGLILTCSFLNM